MFVALILLASVGTAAPECAWVLWSMSTEKPRTTYVDGAELTARQQRAAERDFIQLNADLAAKHGVPNRGRESYLCLPDTIDPRGAKGDDDEPAERSRDHPYGGVV